MKRNFSDVAMADVVSTLMMSNGSSNGSGNGNGSSGVSSGGVDHHHSSPTMDPNELHYAFFGAAMPFVPNKRPKTSINGGSWSSINSMLQ